jgi:general stress protein YciG
MATDDRGFAAMDEQKRKDLASKGGHSQGAENNPANFANDKKKARDAGKDSNQKSQASTNS